MYRFKRSEASDWKTIWKKRARLRQNQHLHRIGNVTLGICSGILGIRQLKQGVDCKGKEELSFERIKLFPIGRENK